LYNNKALTIKCGIGYIDKSKGFYLNLESYFERCSMTHMVGYDKKMKCSITIWLDMTRKLSGGDLVGFNVNQ
jgi:hypothetical protein